MKNIVLHFANNETVNVKTTITDAVKNYLGKSFYSATKTGSFNKVISLEIAK